MVVRILGCSFSWVGPVASAEKSLIPVSPVAGIMDIVNMTIPKPPVQCVNERQKRIPWDKDSTWLIMVEPVVVKPETVSKKASEMLEQEPVSKNGIIPKAEKIIHVKATIM